MNDNIYIDYPLSKQCCCLTSSTKLGNVAYQIPNNGNVYANRLLLSNRINIPLSRFVFVYQSHSDRILKVDNEHLGKGLNLFQDGMDCDALYTYLKQVPLCIFHADCVPIFFCSEKDHLVGIIHSGFIGSLKHITFKAIKKVLEVEKIDPSSLRFYLGPYRRKQSFLLNEEDVKKVIEANLKQCLFDQYFDNGLAIKLDLFALGIKEEQIHDCSLDTFSDQRFYSAHRTKIKNDEDGRLLSLIYLK